MKTRWWLYGPAQVVGRAGMLMSDLLPKMAISKRPESPRAALGHPKAMRVRLGPGAIVTKTAQDPEPGDKRTGSSRGKST